LINRGPTNMDRPRLLAREKDELVPPGVFDRHEGLTESMRRTLMRWLFEVNASLKDQGSPEAVQTAAALTDAHFASEVVTRSTIQLVGVTAMMIALKLYGHAVRHCAACDLDTAVYLCDDTYTKEQIRDMEWRMLAAHDFAAQRVIPLHLYCLDVSPNALVDRIARMLMDVGATLVCTRATRHLPSAIVVAAVELAVLAHATDRIDVDREYSELQISMMLAVESMRDSPKGKGIPACHPEAFNDFFAWYREEKPSPLKLGQRRRRARAWCPDIH